MYLEIIIATISEPPLVAFDLNISPSPNPINTAPNMQESRISSSTRALLPQAPTGDVTVAVNQDDIALTFSPSGQFGEIDSLSFVPDEGEMIDYNAQQNMQHKAGVFTLNMKFRVTGSLFSSSRLSHLKNLYTLCGLATPSIPNT